MPVLDLGGRSLAYRDTGTGFPVLFGHSYLWDAGMWAPQVQALSATCRCLVPELWNHGSSQDVPLGDVYDLDRLAEIACPTAVVVGEQDRSRPPPEAERLTAGIRGATLHRLENAGHICNLEAPEAFTRIVQDVLARIR